MGRRLRPLVRWAALLLAAALALWWWWLVFSLAVLIAA